MTRRVKATAPATVANVACGFDVLGFAIEGMGDEVHAWKGGTPGVHIDSIEGDDGVLPTEATLNTAAIAAQAVLDEAGEEASVVLHLKKGIPASG